MIKFDERNYRKHSTENKAIIKKSLKECGAGRSILLDNSDTIIAGNGVYEQAKKLKIPVKVIETDGKELIAVKRTDLDNNDEKRRNLAVMDNSTSDLSEFDIDALAEDFEPIELVELGVDLGNLDTPSVTLDNDDDDSGDDESYLLNFNYLNLQKAQFDGVGKYGIPQLEPTYTMPENWCPFHWLRDKRFLSKYGKNTDDLGVQFFIGDHRFNQVWNMPDKYLDLLGKYHTLLTPDFSIFMDYPLSLQIFNHYRKHWCGAYWQMQGYNVIPTITWGDERSFEFCFDGEPVGGIVATSAMSMLNDAENDYNFRRGFDLMIEKLEPCKILFYGKIPDDLDTKGIDIVNVGKFYQEFIKEYGE